MGSEESIKNRLESFGYQVRRFEVKGRSGMQVLNENGKRLHSSTFVNADWGVDLLRRLDVRKQKGCWCLKDYNCDCPACGGFND